MTTTSAPPDIYDPTICPALQRGDPHQPHIYRYSMDDQRGRQDCPGLPMTEPPNR